MRVFCLSAAMVFALGCSSSSSDDDGGTKGEGLIQDTFQGDTGGKKPCPQGGLGVTAKSGKSCSAVIDPNDPDVIDCAAQMTNYKDYACSEPQICPDVGVQSLPGFVVGSPPPAVTFVVTNCSTGTKKLRISSIEMEGDTRCSFGFNPASDVSATEIGPGESAMVKATYAPQSEGEDHAAITIYSDAQNFPGLMLPLCAKAVKAGGGGTDPLTCKMVSGVEPCHKP